MPNDRLEVAIEESMGDALRRHLREGLPAGEEPTLRVSAIEWDSYGISFPIPDNAAYSLEALNATAQQFRPPHRWTEPDGSWVSSHAWQNFRALEGYLDEWAQTVLPQGWDPVAVYWVTSPTSPVWTKRACTINQHGQCYLRCDIVTPVVPHTQQIGAEIHRWHMTVNLWNRDYRSPGLPRKLSQMAVAFITECWRQLETRGR